MLKNSFVLVCWSAIVSVRVSVRLWKSLNIENKNRNIIPNAIVIKKSSLRHLFREYFFSFCLSISIASCLPFRKFECLCFGDCVHQPICLQEGSSDKLHQLIDKERSQRVKWHQFNRPNSSSSEHLNSGECELISFECFEGHRSDLWIDSVAKSQQMTAAVFT